jgi:hypothetical protein
MRNSAGLAGTLLLFGELAATGRAASPDYLRYVRQSADVLLDKGRDVYGPRKTPLWAGVIDTTDMSVPAKGVPPPRGVRESDRAVGGCNLYHDVVTLQVMHVLSAVTREPRYADAAREYVRFFLRNTRNERTGLLGWGEHLYYDFFRDAVAEERQSHELLEWTPPWPLLWREDPEAVTAAIAGLRYHFFADDPGALFNRHASWANTERQSKGQPWMKHSGLCAYSCMFLHSRTRDPLWLRWSLGPAALYWNHRNPETNLTPSCLGDPRLTAQNPTPGATELAYWLLKAWELNHEHTELRDRAVTLLRSWDRYLYDPAGNRYLASVGLDGKPLNDNSMQVWDLSYGNGGILPVGRIAAYFARTLGGKQEEAMARRIARIARDTPAPVGVTLEGLAFALNLSLDLYDLGKDRADLETARRYADLAIGKYWRAGLFVREPGDRYYEAKVAVGDLLAGLTRLHLRGNGLKDPGLYDWSF